MQDTMSEGIRFGLKIGELMAAIDELHAIVWPEGRIPERNATISMPAGIINRVVNIKAQLNEIID